MKLNTVHPQTWEMRNSNGERQEFKVRDRMSWPGTTLQMGRSGCKGELQSMVESGSLLSPPQSLGK